MTIAELIEATRVAILADYAPSRARALALTKLDEAELWLTVAEPTPDEMP